MTPSAWPAACQNSHGAAAWAVQRTLPCVAALLFLSGLPSDFALLSLLPVLPCLPQNMITGVTKGYEYKMRLVYAHFPININIEGGWVGGTPDCASWAGQVGGRRP